MKRYMRIDNYLISIDDIIYTKYYEGIVRIVFKGLDYTDNTLEFKMNKEQYDKAVHFISTGEVL